MDRFIDDSFESHLDKIFNLKSNMDRFIGIGYAIPYMIY